MSTERKLRNIGPKSAAWLRQVGLRTLEDLDAIGAVGRSCGSSAPASSRP